MRNCVWAVAICLATLMGGARAAPADVTVSAAISLKGALEKAQPELEKAIGEKIVFNFGASGTLLSQIEKGAPVDLFISADRATADKMARDKAGDQATEKTVARNQLVLIVSRLVNDQDHIPTSFADIMRARKVAVGDPKVVPAGAYAKQVFTQLKEWDDLERSGKLVTAENVAQVLTYVRRGDAEAGVVYATDAKGVTEVNVVATADASQHDPIDYVSEVVSASAKKEAAGKLQEALLTDKVQGVFREFGFVAPPAAMGKGGN